MSTKDLISWKTVRAFGELEILSRASAFFLISVPIIAALWPPINASIIRMTTVAVDLQDSQLSENTGLPHVWALAFVAALCALLAQLIYQTSAPPLVRDFSQDEYIKQQAEMYQLNPGTQKIEELSNSLFNIQHEPSEQIKKRLDHLKNAQNKQQERSERELRDANLAYYTELLGYKYIFLAKDRRYAAIICLILYLFTLSIVIFILLNQSINVFQAARWI